jgi:hypothetical protein
LEKKKKTKQNIAPDFFQNMQKMTRLAFGILLSKIDTSHHNTSVYVCWQPNQKEHLIQHGCHQSKSKAIYSGKVVFVKKKRRLFFFDLDLDGLWPHRTNHPHFSIRSSFATDDSETRRWKNLSEKGR